MIGLLWDPPKLYYYPHQRLWVPSPGRCHVTLSDQSPVSSFWKLNLTRVSPHTCLGCPPYKFASSSSPAGAIAIDGVFRESARGRMDGNGGCCIARCVGRAYDYDMSKLDRIMLKFRPIAPKPIASHSVSGVSKVEAFENAGKNTKGKRKYVRESLNSNKKRCKRRASTEEITEPVVTLPLLPETPERKDSPARGSPMTYKEDTLNLPACLSFTNHAQAGRLYRSSPVGLAVPMAQSFITMECVTDTWIDIKELGFTDEERLRSLDSDTCPGFISDGNGRVTWTNTAYREMVGQREVEGTVWLVMKECFPVENGPQPSPAATCRLRVQYGRGKERNSVTVPCDVWRMDECGFAWRLDVKAALCLGR